MSDNRNLTAEFPALRKEHTKQDQEEVRIQTQIEALETQFAEVKAAAKEEFKVDSLEGLREASRKETQARVAGLDKYRTILGHRRAILDHIHEASAEIDK